MQPEPGSKADSPLSVVRVMVIDDQRAMRAILRDLLHTIGIHDVMEATNGEDALLQFARLAANEQRPDVILCDLHMEKMDGLEFVAHVRRGKAGAIDRHIPILLLTGESDEMMLEVVEQVGATEILPKPISAGDLGKAIEKAVGLMVTRA